MIPVTQRLIDRTRGDCFSACLASILEVPEVPCFHMEEHKDTWTQYNEWLAPYNLQLVSFRFGSVPPPYGYSILAVRSALYPEVTHAVVYFYDPRTGIGGVVWNPNPLDPRGCDIPTSEFRRYHVLALVDPAQVTID